MSLLLLFPTAGPVTLPPPITWPTDATLVPQLLTAAVTTHTATAPLTVRAAIAELSVKTENAEILHG